MSTVSRGKIPKFLFQSWKTHEIPEKMKDNVKKLREMNPEYEYFLYDDDECRSFLEKHFGFNYANAFDVLVPGAFKCDLWRYAVLYIYGGVYIDIDMVPLVPLREILYDDDEFVSVADKAVLAPDCGIYQAFLACQPRHPIMYYSLQLSFSNIATRRYDILETLSITGPTVAGLAFNLFRRIPDTHRTITPGEYPTGVRLLDMDKNWVYDLDGKKIFKNRYEGYSRGIGNYSKVMNYYTDNPRHFKYSLLRYIFFGLIILVIVLFIAMFIYRGKYRKLAGK